MSAPAGTLAPLLRRVLRRLVSPGPPPHTTITASYAAPFDPEGVQSAAPVFVWAAVREVVREVARWIYDARVRRT